MLAAKPHECLPPFPAPTHLVPQFHRTPHDQCAHCDVGFPDEASFERAHDPVFVADALDDLPPVGNAALSDIATYLTPPRSPYQARAACIIEVAWSC